MVEPIMYIGIGFLVAGLLVIGVIPLVHARAVRLTVRRLEALTPLSMAEIQAEKDQLRAEFAMSMSRLEMSVEQMKAKSASQLAEIGRKTEAIGRLKFELGEKTAALLALEAKEKQLSEDLRAWQTQHTAKASALEEGERALASTQAELAQVAAQLHQSSMATEGQRVELAAMRAQSEVFHNEIGTYEKEITSLKDRLGKKTAEATALGQQLAEERSRTDQLREDAKATRAGEGSVRAELAGMRSKSETLAAEKALIESELKRSHDERDKLQRELAAIKRDVQNAGAGDSTENAVLRESINDVAAQVARLTATLEGAESPIEAILQGGAQGSATPAGGNGASPGVPPRVGEAADTLADRIRTLQGRAARVPSAAAPRSRTQGAGARKAE
jgi:chromosome segregation ATPase